MGVVTNIIDALRSIGSVSQKAALRRQDGQLVGKEVLERRQVNIDGQFGRAHAFIATTAPMEESVPILSEDEVRPINENVLFGGHFLEIFGIPAGGNWTLTELDAAFKGWLLAPDKRGFTDDAVMELLGAPILFKGFTVLANRRWIATVDRGCIRDARLS